MADPFVVGIMMTMLSTALLALVLAGVAGPIDLDRAAALFAEAERLSAIDGGELWGRELYGPMIFVDPRSRQVVTNVPDADGRLRPASSHPTIHVGQLDADVPVGNTAVEWAGVRWSMVIWPIGGPGSGALLMHESFHRLQPDLRLPLLSPENRHLDTGDGRIWLRLEWRALRAALDGGAGADEAIVDALTFRARRHGLFGADAAEEERQLELNEGLAEYTGLRLGGASPEDARVLARDALARFDGGGSLVRSFAYASGPAYGLLLDDRAPHWRRRIRANADIGDLLARAVRYRRPRDPAAVARERGMPYGLAEIEAQEDAREMARQDRLDALRARFVDAPRLILPVGGGFQYSFNPYDMESVDGHGTYYATMQATGDWGRLVVTGGVLLIDEGQGRRALVVAAPTGLPDGSDGGAITGDGWVLDLAAGVTLVPGRRDGDVTVR